MNAGIRAAERRIPRAEFATVAILACALAASPARAASVSATDGKVLYLKSGSYTWAQVSRGQIVNSGDQLKTATDARASVVFDDGSRVELAPGTSFTLQQASPAASEMKVTLGGLKAWISKSLNRRFQVRTPTAVCSVRGTEFSVAVDRGGETRVQMFSGLLAVSDRSGNEVLLKDRQGVEVTQGGLGRVTDARSSGEGGAGGEESDTKRTARREVDLRMSKEEVQAAAALEAKLSEYQQGKSLIDVNGNRVRVEEYIVRPAPDQFKLVVLNSRENRFDYFFYQGTFNTALPADMSVALRQLPGCIGGPCQYHLTSYRTARSNTIDNMLEVASGGHQVDVNNNAVGTQDDVQAAYDPSSQNFVSLPTGTPFYKTLFDNYNLSFNGVTHQSWTGTNIQNMVSGQALAPTFTNVTSVRSSPFCAPPNCTYNEISEGVFHDVVYASNLDQSIWEKYDSYVISDEGKIARTTDFSATGFSGTNFKQALLGWNFQTIVTASEFQGRKIDLVVEPKIFIQSGLIP